MRVPPRVLALASFVILGMVALVVAGLLDWIVGVLFLSMEFLGEVLRNLFRRRRERRHPPSRARRASIVTHRAVDGHRGYARRRGRPRRKHAKHLDGDPAAGEKRLRILIPVSGDESDLIDFAVEECRSRHAEMILLFLRPLAVTPMGPTSLPGLAEDDEAQATFDRVGTEAERLGVPLRTLYATTADLPATIGEFARDVEADVVLVGSTRRAGFARFLSRDPTPSILKMLPGHASLTIRAS
jgi:nucleotide-binding universal stress UspA family protein